MIQFLSNPYASTQSHTAGGAPIVRIRSWWREAVIIGVGGTLLGAAYLRDNSTESIVLAVAVYLAYSWCSRLILTRSHRRGIRLVRLGRYEEAIPCFEDSFRFFSRYPWIDTCRVLTLMSPSKMSYREMALCNVAFCHSQTGNGAKAKELYQSVLTAFPENPLAPVALRMIESGQQIGATSTSG